ncbi:hypothetical protein SASPL_101559 [Salvia splendens]|uniref:Uncharacterized protein n=1 Tax=Salvia splendens TaxID=180675 RepID=A0A8X8YU72_SALSN|nr:hypothetical protein SASPL_101559 [Salvia splendens]
MAKAKEKILKFLLHLPKPNMMLRKNKVGPMISPPTLKQNEILLERENSLSFGRRDGEYLQARRVVLSSYHLINGGANSDTFKQKMKSSFKGVSRQARAAVRTRVGVGVYRVTVACPWSGTSGEVVAFRCFLPHLKSTKKPSCMQY